MARAWHCVVMQEDLPRPLLYSPLLEPHEEMAHAGLAARSRTEDHMLASSRNSGSLAHVPDALIFVPQAKTLPPHARLIQEQRQSGSCVRRAHICPRLNPSPLMRSLAACCVCCALDMFL